MKTLTHSAMAGLLIACAGAAPARGDPGAPARPALPAKVMAEISPERIRASIDKLVSFGTRHTLSETKNPIKGIGAARLWLTAEMASYNQNPAGGKGQAGLMKPFTEMWNEGPSDRLPEGAEIHNIIGVIRGRKQECENHFYYVVAHYDSRNGDPFDFTGDAPGANDNASGVAAVLEIARALADEPLDASVVFMLSGGEEQGLFGARYRAQQAVAQEQQIFAVLNNDIIGDPTAPAGPDGRPGPVTRNLVRVFSSGLDVSGSAAQREARLKLAAENDSPSRQLARYIAEVAQVENTAVRPMLVFRTDRFLRGGDHVPFAEAGYPAVRFTEVDEDYTRQHQDVREEGGVRYGDTAEFVDPAYIADVARLNAAVLVHLANAPIPPRHARIITRELVNTTTIRWDKNPESDFAGYEVVWRDTAATTWQDSKDVGLATEVILPMSKDNFFFGVRAYDKDGYKGPVSFPIASPE